MKQLYLFLVAVILCSSYSSTHAQNALSFDGVDDYVFVNNASSHIANSNMSLSFWVYPTNPSPSFPNFDGMAGFRNNSNADFYILHLSTSTVEARFRNSSGTNYDIVYNGISLNTWNHLVMTYDGAAIRLYHNGTLVGTQSASGFITSTSESFYMGDLLFGGTNFYLNGQLDDVALWSKGLSGVEVTALYNACRMDLTASNLALCYEFNQGVAGGNNTTLSSVIDSKGNINGFFVGFDLMGSSSNFVAYSKDTYASLAIATCGSPYTSPSGNYVWTAAGIYHDTLTGVNAIGCDSILTINLSHNTSTATINPQTCGSYTSPSGDSTWMVSGGYTDILVNHLGCDSIITINLTINPVPDTSVVVNVHTLMATQVGATYQWVNCDSSFAEITGETNASFTPTADGNYAVIIDLNGCVDTSNCFSVLPVSTVETFKTKITTYPNPTTGLLQVDLGQLYQEMTLEVLDIKGRVVQQQFLKKAHQVIITINEPSGIYFLKISSGQYTEVLKVLVR